MINDSTLWNKLKHGDVQSFELIFKIYYPQLCLFANKYTKDFELAREVVQDMFVYVWENKDKLQDKKSIKSYFHAAVKFNSIRKFNDRNIKQVKIEEIPEYDLKDDFKDEIEFVELQEAIFNTIESLPPKCKKVFKLSRFEQMTYSNIAIELNISKKTVEAQISKALKILQKTFEDYLLIIIIVFITATLIF